MVQELLAHAYLMEVLTGTKPLPLANTMLRPAKSRLAAEVR